MKQVEFEHVTSELCGWGLGKGNRYEFANVEEIITRRVQEGWTFQGYVPLTTRGTGEADSISLVFVREQD